MLLDKLKNILPNNNIESSVDFQKIIQNLYPTSDPDDKKVLFIWDAYHFSQNAHVGQKRHSGKPYFTHCSSVGVTLSDWKMDYKTIAAGLLHDVIEDTKISREEMVEKFGIEVTDLVDGVSNLSDINVALELCLNYKYVVTK